MSNSNGKITAPVSMTDIATVVGRTSDFYLGVNRHSKNKPFVTNGNEYSLQTDADRKDAAYGFYWWNKTHESDAPCAWSKEDLLDKAIANSGKWAYKYPTRERMGDFREYNHNAVAPYDYLATTPDFGKTYYLKAYTDTGDTNREVLLSLMPEFEADTVDALSAFRIAAVYRRNDISGATTYAAYSDYTVADMDADNANVESFSVLLSGLAGDTVNGSIAFDLVFAATNAADIEDGDDEMWIYLPETLTTMVYELESGLILRYYPNDPNIQGFVVSDSTNNFVTTEDGEAYTLGIELEMTGEFGYDLECTWYLYLWQDGASIDEWDVTEGSLTLEDENPEYLLIEKSIDDAVSGATAGDVRIALDFRYRKSGTTGSYSYKHFDFINEKSVDGQVVESQSHPTLYDVISERISIGEYPN